MLLPLLCLVFVVAFEQAHASSTWGMVEVLLASEHHRKTPQHSELDDFNELVGNTFCRSLLPFMALNLQFDEFAQSQGLHLNKRNFRELETNINGLPAARYGLRHIDCEEFRKFLSGIKAQKYHLEYAKVSCGPMSFSFCMAFSCDPDDYQPRASTAAMTTTIEKHP
ncbi:hypothetical protein OESDEN_06743 [Oesophagostomum dentatum]|uniref:Uncharacterized protein n=1 Tax=Oesophagostomum dentatum TaxID=61180 RepID=A0A0B1TBY8_OESDE|nr:hypothetical protein OESDEN_06743 [Oesophagostomum dentatum]